MEQKKENIARFGIGAKGFVYVLIGGLTLMAAIGRGGSKSGSSEALKFLSASTIGMILLGITALGLVAYVLWRFYQAFADPEDKGTDAKGLARRIGYFSSRVFLWIPCVYRISNFAWLGRRFWGRAGVAGCQVVKQIVRANPGCHCCYHFYWKSIVPNVQGVLRKIPEKGERSEIARCSAPYHPVIRENWIYRARCGIWRNRILNLQGCISFNFR